ncbi:MAG TPA: PAS domain S-box protein, partial [Cyclobacteriaceae bacterium]|nr:PAS domain S-box protein [Cyclobacteriaceae bacterium]
MIPRKKGSLKRLIDHLPVVVFEYTFFPDGRRDFTYISPRSEDLLGVNPNELMRGHLRLSDFIHPDDWTSFNESVVESVKEMKDWKWEGKCKGKDGFIWLSSKGIPVCMRDGRIVYNGVFEDITDQKKLQQQQIDTEQRYRELVEQLPLGIVIHAKGKILLANAAAARIIGAGKADDLIGINPIQFLHPDSLEIVKERIRMILGGKGVPPLEEKFIRLDGRIIHVESSGQLYWYLGEPAVQVIFTDITERKKTEASFQKTEKLFYQLFQNTPLAVTLLNEEGLVVQINKGFAEMFGYTETELKGKSLNQFIVPNNLET